MLSQRKTTSYLTNICSSSHEQGRFVVMFLAGSVTREDTKTQLKLVLIQLELLSFVEERSPGTTILQYKIGSVCDGEIRDLHAFLNLPPG